MNAKNCLLFAVAAVFAAQVVACSSEFTSCIARRACAPGGSAGMGEAGEPSSNGGAAPRAEGGAAGIGVVSSGPGALGEGGDVGVAGARDAIGDAGAGGAAGAGDAAGEGGAAGAPELAPSLFGPCAAKGEVVCDGHASAQRLACDGMKWQAGTTCGASQLCDSLTGKCADKVADCASAAPGTVVCRGDVPVTCGPDLVTANVGPTCAGLCNSGVCQPPVCGDKKVEPGEDCDDGALTKTGACVLCKTASCGDGAVYAGHEQCDDKNQLSGDGCSATCAAEPVALALGVGFTCALGSNGVLKCWGNNGAGQLGLGDALPRGDGPDEMGSKLLPVALGTNRTAKSIAAGRDNACALLDNGQVKCWGTVYSGVLGAAYSDARGDAAAEMGDALNPITFGTDRVATSLSLADSHACAVLNTGELKCWGLGTSGQLGQDSTVNIATPDQSLPAIKLGPDRTAKAATTGNRNYTCALLDDASVKCWGSPVFGLSSSTQNLGGGTGFGTAYGDFPGEMAVVAAYDFGSSYAVKAIASGDADSCALLNDNSVKCWGHNGLVIGAESGLGQVNPSLVLPVNLGLGRKAKAISLSVAHVCAVLDNGAVKCWGSNGSGQLGIGSVDDQGDEPNEMGDALKAVPLGRLALQVAVGDKHSCAILDDGTVKCWGANDLGQLGVGDTLPRGDSGGLSGVVLKTVDLKF